MNATAQRNSQIAWQCHGGGPAGGVLSSPALVQQTGLRPVGSLAAVPVSKYQIALFKKKLENRACIIFSNLLKDTYSVDKREMRSKGKRGQRCIKKHQKKQGKDDRPAPRGSLVTAPPGSSALSAPAPPLVWWNRSGQLRYVGSGAKFSGGEQFASNLKGLCAGARAAGARATPRLRDGGARAASRRRAARCGSSNTPRRRRGRPAPLRRTRSCRTP